MNLRYISIIFIMCAIITNNSFSQTFEGTITYLVEFEIETQKFGDIEITEEQVIDKMKKDGEYFDTITITLKDGNYIKTDNSEAKKNIVYFSELNKIYNFQEGFEYVIITDANRYNSLDLDLDDPEVELIDSIKTINDIDCKLLKLSYGKMGSEYYYYNSEVLKLDPKLFENHNYEYLNSVINLINSYPLQIEKTLSNFISVKMTFISFSKEEINDSVFDLPKLKKAEKDYSELMKTITGSDVMKIKNFRKK